MPSVTSPAVARSERRDFYTVLGAQPSASTAELRAAFREAVLRHHPDRAQASEVATRRTSVLNRAWAELRDPLRRMHYDHALESGVAATLEWPLEEGDRPAPPLPPRTRHLEPIETSPWHQPQWRNVEGFRVPAEVWLAGPRAQRAWIIEHHIDGQDWREHRERYWLRYAGEHFRDRGRTEEWLGALERLVEIDPSFETLVQSRLRDAYVAAHQELRGAAFLRGIGERFGTDTPPRRWIQRELRALLAEFRDKFVRRGRTDERAENAELLLNYLDALGMEAQFADSRAAIVAHRRAGNLGRATELVERVAAAPVTEPGRWFSLVQLLTEAGQLERASALLAEIARGEHPDALDPRIPGRPWRRIATARRRLSRAQVRALRAG